MKALMFISFQDFRDEEYFIPKQILTDQGIEVITVSDSLGIAIGKSGGEAKVDILIKDAKDYDALILIGGSGMIKHFDNQELHSLIQKSIQENKLIAGICIAPVILAKAGILNNKKATVWSSDLDKSAVKILKEQGAVYQDEAVVQDSNIITANGPLAANEFGLKIKTNLCQKQ